MNRLGLTMVLNPGKIEEYKLRHDKIWPELKELLSEFGISDYVIYVDEKTHVLYASFKVVDKEVLKDIPKHPIVKKWWAYMADIMETNPDNSPQEFLLKEVFYMS
jgi:L-rhamnose mutarotase